LWRREGHVRRLEDLEAALDPGLLRIVVGTGAYGRSPLLTWNGNWRSVAWTWRCCRRPMRWTASTRCWGLVSLAGRARCT
jgi:hypothetical protein